MVNTKSIIVVKTPGDGVRELAQEAVDTNNVLALNLNNQY